MRPGVRSAITGNGSTWHIGSMCPWNDHVPHMETPCPVPPCASLHLPSPLILNPKPKHLPQSLPEIQALLFPSSPSTLLPPPSQSKHLPQSLPEIQALQQLQAELGQSGQALLLLCDCGGKYLCVDSQERKKVGRRLQGRPEDRPSVAEGR